MNPIELTLFSSRLSAICDEMGVVLRKAAFSPNIRDRLDYSCAIFDATGNLSAQAAHIPVHLGSMAYAMRDIVSAQQWRSGDMLVLNDPYLGGTHLPDVTLIAPLFAEGELAAFVVNRAHHADIGAHSPGSMPVSSNLEEEGRVIPPQWLVRDDEIIADTMSGFTSTNRRPRDSMGDFSAQISANRNGIKQLSLMIGDWGLNRYREGLAELNAYGEKIALAAIVRIPDGSYEFNDVMDDDGQGSADIRIQLKLTIADGKVTANFNGTALQVPGNINCPLPVTAAAVLYAFRCLMPPETPACAGVFKTIDVVAPEGCLLNAIRPAAVAAGNVETSTRVVDVVLGALADVLPERIPAASHGSMNNLAMGSDTHPAWDYYETMGGGAGANASAPGLDGVQTHMTNTRNTPVEVLETTYPVYLKRYALRRGSGGDGVHRGGDGLIREFVFKQPTQISLLTERRLRAPWAINGGSPGLHGVNLLDGDPLPAKISLKLEPGQCLRIESPGGGGWGRAPDK